MFVKIFAVLYELRLERLEGLSGEAHRAYKNAFQECYKLSDEYAALCAEYENIPKYLWSEADQALIDAAGGRQLEAFAAMNDQEKVVTKIDRAVSRVRARLSYPAAKSSRVPAPSHKLAITSRSVVLQ